MAEHKVELYFFTAFFLAVFALVCVLFLPFVGALAAALVLATLVMPLYTTVLGRLKQRTVSALLVVVFVVLAIVLPALGLLYLLVGELVSLANSIKDLDLSVLPPSLLLMRDTLLDVLPFLGQIQYDEMLASTIQEVVNHAGSFLTGTADVLLKMVVTIIALYYFLKDGRTFLYKTIALSPLSDEEDVQIVQKLKAVSFSLIRGTLVIAFLQGLLTGIGFVLFGIPNPVLWGSVAGISALIPTVGIALVTVPGFAYLVYTGDVVSALGFAAWCALVAGMVDNVLGPKLIGSSAQIHPLFILLSVLGGLWLFGVAGFLLGPLVFGLLVALSEIYSVKIKQMHETARHVRSVHE